MKTNAATHLFTFTCLFLIYACNARTCYNPSDSNSITTNPTITSVIIDSISHPCYENLQVYFFRPSNIESTLPTVFFCHGIGATNPERYRFLIDYVVRHNVCVCYSSYEPVEGMISPLITYRHLWKGFVAGQRHWRRYIDKSQIGFIGHSYGGGAAPNMAWRAVHKRKWGSKVCFVYIMAPWYCHSMTPARFNDFPSHTILVTQVFEDDQINDYRMAKDIYRSFRIPAWRKCFLSVFSANHGKNVVPANHSVPENNVEGNYLGKYVVYPVIDSLMTYAFNDSAALQCKKSRRTGQLRTTGTVDGWECRFYKGTSCSFDYPQHRYLNFWGHGMNPRQKGTRFMPPPVRLTLQTPQTVLRYCAFGVGKIGEAEGQ